MRKAENEAAIKLKFQKLLETSQGLGPVKKFVGMKAFSKFASKNDTDFEKTREKSHKYFSKLYDTDYDEYVAIGDIHGDMASFLTALYIAKCIDDTANWLKHEENKKRLVVQLGDMLDNCRSRCDQQSISADSMEEIKLLEYTLALDKQARKNNEGLVCLTGNHDMIALFMDWTKYMSLPSRFPLKDGRTRMQVFRESPGFLEYCAIRRPVLLTTPTCWTFVHGDLETFCKNIIGHDDTDDAIRMMRMMTFNQDDNKKHNVDRRKELGELVINEWVDCVLLAKSKSVRHKELIQLFPTVTAMVTDRFFSRTKDKSDSCRIINGMLKQTFGVDVKVVMGHTPCEHIVRACGQSITFADIMMSSGFDEVRKNGSLIHYSSVLCKKNGQSEIIAYT